MEKVDLLIAATGTVALLATVAGVAFYDDLSGEADLSFPERTLTLAPQEAALAPPGVAEFSWNATENATAVLLDVTLSFEGQALQGGAATVEFRVTAPDGAVTLVRESWAIEAAATSAQATFHVAARWAQPPAPVRAEPALHPAGLSWDEPIGLRVVVSPPADGAAPGLAQYGFHAAAEGTLYTFSAVEDAAAMPGEAA